MGVRRNGTYLKPRIYWSQADLPAVQRLTSQERRALCGRTTGDCFAIGVLVVLVPRRDDRLLSRYVPGRMAPVYGVYWVPTFGLPSQAAGVGCTRFVGKTNSSCAITHTFAELAATTSAPRRAAARSVGRFPSPRREPPHNPPMQRTEPAGKLLVVRELARCRLGH